MFEGADSKSEIFGFL